MTPARPKVAQTTSTKPAGRRHRASGSALGAVRATTGLTHAAPGGVELAGGEDDDAAPPRSARHAALPVASLAHRGPTWPALASLGLSAQAVAQRRSSIGGSDANTILSGDPARIARLWREKRGLVEGEDLSGKLAVMLGSWTEAFNRQWYEKMTGETVGRIGEAQVCRIRPWRTATLDGVVEAKGAIWEAKHTSAFAKADEVLTRYMPQLQHSLAVTGCELALLSVIYGNHKWEVYEIASDWMYQEDLLEAEMRFWHCVQSGEAPAICIVDHVPKPLGVREVNMTGNNGWAAAAADWLANREAAKVHASAATCLRELIEDDVACAFGHGIEAKRNRAGAITIGELTP